MANSEHQTTAGLDTKLIAAAKARVGQALQNLVNAVPMSKYEAEAAQQSWFFLQAVKEQAP